MYESSWIDSQNAWIQILSLSLSVWVTMGKSLPLSEPPFTYLCNEGEGVGQNGPKSTSVQDILRLYVGTNVQASWLSSYQ